MAEITDRTAPADIPKSSDTLAGLVDPDQPDPKQRTEMYLSGAHVFTLDKAPSGLERFTLLVDVEVYEAGGVRFTGEDGETQVPICKVRRIGDMYLPGTQRPPTKDEIAAMKAAADAKRAAEEKAEQEENQPPMFGDDGEPVTDAEDPTDPEDDDLGRPPFSDGPR